MQYTFQADIIAESETILKLGLLFAKDAELTPQGIPEVMTFQHKLFMEYIAAVYLSEQTKQNPEYIKSVFPTWKDIEKHSEIFKFTCGLLKDTGADHIVDHAVECSKQYCLEQLEGGKFLSFFKNDRMFSTLDAIQREAGITNANCGVFPLHQQLHSMSTVPSGAQFVVIKDLILKEEDLSVLAASDIVVSLVGDFPNFQKMSWNSHKMSGTIQTLQKCRENILAIQMFLCENELVSGIASLMPATRLAQLHIESCYLSPENISTLKGMPQLIYLSLQEIDNLAPQGHHLVAAIQAWKGQSRLKKLDLLGNNLPASVCKPLLAAVAANCRRLEEIQLFRNTLTGFLAIFLQDPPSALTELWMNNTGLQAEDIESLAAALAEGKMQQLIVLDIRGNNLSETDASVLLHPLLNSTTMDIKL